MLNTPDGIQGLIALSLVSKWQTANKQAAMSTFVVPKVTDAFSQTSWDRGQEDVGMAWLKTIGPAEQGLG